MSNQTQQPPVDNLPAPKPSKTERLRKAFEDPMIAGMFASVLQTKGKTDSFKTSMIELYTSDDKLQKCEPAEIIKEALKMAVMGLPVNKTLGFSWIIAYKKRIQQNGQWVDYFYPTAQLGYRGYIQLAIRTGEYKHINADVVYEGELKSRDKLSGEIDLSGEPTSNKVIGYFAHLETLDGFRKTLYSTSAQVTAHAERYSKGYDPKDPKNIWSTNFDEMATKTVLRALLSKWGLLSPELETALADDLKADSKFGDPQDEIDKTANTQFTDFKTVTDDGQHAPDGVDPDTGEVTQLTQGDPNVFVQQTVASQTAEPVVQRGRGRPPGSKNQAQAQLPLDPDAGQPNESNSGEAPPNW